MDIYPFLKEGLIFAVCIAVCALLMKSRFSYKISLLISGGFLLFAAGVNVWLLLSGRSAMYVLTQLILTAYLPMIICLHILSAASLSKTAVIWSFGLAIYFILTFVVKLAGRWLPGGYFAGIVQLLVSAAVLFIVVRWIRKPFIQYITGADEDFIAPWLPLLLCLIMFSYFYNSPMDSGAFVLLVLLTAAVFLVVARAFRSAGKALSSEREKAVLAHQLDIQSERLRSIMVNREQEKIYRHDMKHHLTALDGLLRSGDVAGGHDYVHQLMGEMEELEIKKYCTNQAVNAVLTHYISQAKDVGCRIETDVQISETLPVEDMDLCVIFANALENAVRACGRIEDKSRRHIAVKAESLPYGVAISVVNSCTGQIEFDKEGFPVSEGGEGHGYGLRSIRAAAEKYNGFCTYALEEQSFSVKAVLFSSADIPPEKAKHTEKLFKKIFHMSALTLLTFCLMLNLSPLFADAAEGAVRKVLVTHHAYRASWGGSAVRIKYPSAELTRDYAKAAEIMRIDSSPADGLQGKLEEQLEKEEAKTAIEQSSITEAGDTPAEGIDVSLPQVIVEEKNTDDDVLQKGVEDVNRQMEQYVEELKAEYRKYISTKYQGYVGLDSDYTVLENDEDILAIRFDTVINAGGSGGDSRIFTLDKKRGKVLELKDLFAEGADYIGVVSSEIKRQMQEQVDAGVGDFFIPGGIWREDDWFQAIQPQQQFYLDEERRLVIVFAEYEVAPGSMGCPEFTIPKECIEPLLRVPSLLR